MQEEGFDKDDVLITFQKDVFYDTIGELEQNYLEFLDMSESFMGWLLTLNDEEFATVFTAYMDGNGMGLHFVEYAHKDIWQILQSEMTKRIVAHKVYLRTIFLVREGIYTYTAGSTDNQWRVSFSEKGKKIVDNFSVLSALRLSRDIALKYQEENKNG